ncbi:MULTISPECIES: Tol-Pal system beta propeller repeat protein TolB [unclassified Novosphingobium]|uniref:Tol-Pal system beta propeller repeat protein TolB n=1 Tax=unclassified Novosphingobium TaxID=2644732 RepID=UPI000A8C4F8E|nr:MULTISPECIES: Tol-Pal system beta propeller repeat protein TolB [unclassified Novosphingobium]MDR6709332.1 TolB protein [Novosphingobium sp. 1748]NKJ02848.1 TolB protein [Novosphingobium sp. SG707]
MMMRKFSYGLLAGAALMAAGAIHAQTIAPAPVVTPTAAPPAADNGVLTGTVSDDTAWQSLGIAIPSFATNADVPTAASAGSTAQLGRAIAEVITGDLKNNGLFKPTGPNSLPPIPIIQVLTPDFPTWSTRGAEMLVHGSVSAASNGNLVVGCYLYDVSLRQQLVKATWEMAPGDWRRAAHKCADTVYSRLSGESPFFDSRIAYIAETGPKDHRMKRLAIMDSDGANHRFITTGQAMALTPRFSPDYRKIVYLSYLNGRPRIYVYDVESASQKLVAETGNPTFAPRWSPDGKWILYSMASAGNTNIYRVSANGGISQKLTETPGINVGGSYSPDGSKIVFESDRGGSQQIYVMNADGSNQRRISFFGGRAATPEWSPRGDQIAFTHIAGNLRIAVMGVDGGGMRYLTNSWQDEAPTWAPNGRIIQFFRTEKGTGKTSIWQVDLTGRNERRLPTPVDGSDPSWGPIRQ